MFGTILKPTSGITPLEVGQLVPDLAGSPLFDFAKEDDNLDPGVTFCPRAERTREAVAARRDRAGDRESRSLLFAPHITAPPDLPRRHLDVALAAGVNAVVFSDQFAGGATRLVPDATAGLDRPPAIYAHNSGISTRTRAVWREVREAYTGAMSAAITRRNTSTSCTPTPGPATRRPYGRPSNSVTPTCGGSSPHLSLAHRWRLTRPPPRSMIALM